MSSAQTRDVIVIGASAGGVSALRTVVSQLPHALPAAVFVVMHVPAFTHSELPALLSNTGHLIARHPADGESIEHGRIYVAPPDCHLLIQDGHLHLGHGPKEQHSRPCINVTFRSAALAYGPRVIGVVLTGELDDGTAGLWEIKRRGGVSVVQNPEHAAYSSMPLSAVRDVEADYIVNLNETGDLLTRLVDESSAGRSRDQEDSVMEPALTDLTCPDCGGTLWELSSGRRKEYRCRVGHVFSPTTILAEQFNKQEAALYSAMVKLQEGVSLTQRLLDSVEPAIREKLREQKKELEAQLDQLRLLLMRRQGLGA